MKRHAFNFKNRNEQAGLTSQHKDFHQLDLTNSDSSIEDEEEQQRQEETEGTDQVKGKYESKVMCNLVFVTAEAAPYSKTGGLGDVCGSLPVALAARGHRVMVVSPRYLNDVSDSSFATVRDVKSRIKVLCFGGEQEVAFFHEYKAGVDWV